MAYTPDHSTALYTLDEHLGSTDEAARLDWAKDLILTAVKDTAGCLEPLTLFVGLQDATARLIARALTSLIDHNIIDARYEVEDGAVKCYLGFSVAA